MIDSNKNAPSNFNSYYPNVYINNVFYEHVFDALGVRPAIALANDLLVAKGDGTSEAPYELLTD